MTLKSKVLAVFVTALVGLYGVARWTIPPTVYVVVSLEDANGARLEIPEDWRSMLSLVEGAAKGDDAMGLTDGLAIACAEMDRAPDKASFGAGMQQWTLTVFGKRKFVSFGGRPGTDVVVAALHSELGMAEEVVSLPRIGEIMPWSVVRVRLRLPGVGSPPRGELELTVLEPDGNPASPCELIRFTSPLAGIPLAWEYGVSSRRSKEAMPLRFLLPPGDYGVQTAQIIGVYCGNDRPFEDRFTRTRQPVEIEAGVTVHAELQQSLGVRLALDVHVTGANVESALPSLLKGLEQDAYESFTNSPKAPRKVVPRWTAKATLRPVSDGGRPRPWYCGWDGCLSVQERIEFPLSGTVEGLEQLAEGDYELTIEGDLIKPFRTTVTIPARVHAARDVLTIPITLEPSQ